jgi:hypothetical protein
MPDREDIGDQADQGHQYPRRWQWRRCFHFTAFFLLFPTDFHTAAFVLRLPCVLVMVHIFSGKQRANAKKKDDPIDMFPVARSRQGIVLLFPKPNRIS